MTAPEPLSLAGEFPKSSPEDWRKLVDAVLKGAPFSRLESRTYDGLTIEPLYERAAAARAIAGRAPGVAWTILQRADHTDPAAANAQARDDLENGATGLSLALRHSVNANGYGLDGSVAALARALDGLNFAPGIAIDIDLPPFARDVPLHVAEAVKSRADPGTTAIRFGYDPVTAFAITGKAP
jgi:methylmalonyl-CoA mutase